MVNGDGKEEREDGGVGIRIKRERARPIRAGSEEGANLGVLLNTGRSERYAVPRLPVLVFRCLRVLAWGFLSSLLPSS